MIESLRLSNFRNHTDFQAEFSAENVVFVGPNGRGKTNILEAIAILSAGKSWRDGSGVSLIEHGQESALIETKSAENSFRCVLQARSRTITRNGKKISFKSHLGNLPTLLFVPEYLHIFHGPKTLRQQFFDRFLSQIFPNYRDTLMRANQAAKQKRAILRNSHLTSSERATEISISYTDVSPWNQILAETIPVIWQIRSDFLAELQPILAHELETVSRTNEPIAIELRSPETFIPTEAGVLDFFQNEFPREIAARKNLLAPTRDDFVFLFRDRPVIATASRGEERSILLALLSAQKKFLTQKICGLPASGVGKSPILLLDDCFSELDADRQSHLQDLCAGTQTFFSTTHVDHFSDFRNVQTIYL